MTDFATSDTHFGHDKILRFCKPRGEIWATVEEHDQGLIDLWNETVGPDDTVFHMGDFAFAGRNRIREVVEQLNGNIILMRGNHDKFKVVRNCGFQSIHEALVHRIGRQRISMAHQPERVMWGDRWNVETPPMSFGLCGHIHLGWKVTKPGALIWEDRSTQPRTIRTKFIPKVLINVGVDQWNHRPVSFENLLSLVQKMESTNESKSDSE